jgi:hypothetical protein
MKDVWIFEMESEGIRKLRSSGPPYQRVNRLLPLEAKLPGSHSTKERPDLWLDRQVLVLIVAMCLARI